MADKPHLRVGYSSGSSVRRAQVRWNRFSRGLLLSALGLFDVYRKRRRRLLGRRRFGWSRVFRWWRFMSDPFQVAQVPVCADLRAGCGHVESVFDEGSDDGGAALFGAAREVVEAVAVAFVEDGRE